jgi:hypothetical protein
MGIKRQIHSTRYQYLLLLWKKWYCLGARTSDAEQKCRSVKESKIPLTLSKIVNIII